MILSEKSEVQGPPSYLLLRLGIGLCFAIHGATRFSQEAYFNDLLNNGFNASLGDVITLIYAYILPAVELIAGFLLCFGFLKRLAIIGLAVVMITWLLSSVLMDYWDSMTTQLLFFFILYWLYFKMPDDQWSFDTFLKQ